jgi:hypothetical protein
MMEQHDTKLWLGGVLVDFVKWTPNALLYNMIGSDDTVGHLSRTTVQRLVREGTLRIEGYRPDWATEEATQEHE